MRAIPHTIVCFVLVAGCTTTQFPTKNYDGPSDSTRFTINLKIWKIDSINRYYLIYGKKGNSLFKIVSRKDERASGQHIHLDKKYNFSLESIWRSKILIDGVTVSPSSIYSVNCLGFDSATYICLERDSIVDLYHADNVKGLCWKKWSHGNSFERMNLLFG